VWAGATAMGEFLPPVLQTCLRRHPDVNVDLREMHVCVRCLEALPDFARDLVALLVEDARSA
jgi:DNA-binding transcriptional LysR family regulator